jgi:hypothetical protein
MMKARTSERSTEMKRRQKRVRAALPVRTWFAEEGGKSVLHAACTIDVTPTGARLTGVQAQAETGAVLTVERGRSKARFRIIWVGEPGTPSEGHLGIECLDAGKWTWDVQLPAAGNADDVEFEPVRVGEDERRKPPPRYSCKGTVELQRDVANAEVMRGQLRDINQLGCFVRVSPPPPLNAHLRLVLAIEQSKLRARGVVHRVDGASGVFVQFTEIHRQDNPALKQLIARLSGSENVTASPAV